VCDFKAELFFGVIMKLVNVYNTTPISQTFCNHKTSLKYSNMIELPSCRLDPFQTFTFISKQKTINFKYNKVK